MGKKNRERLARGEIHREGKIVKVAPCPFPGCSGLIAPGARFNACASHNKLIADVMFIMDHTKRPGEPASPAEMRAGVVSRSRIVLPGDPEFTATIRKEVSDG